MPWHVGPLLPLLVFQNIEDIWLWRSSLLVVIGGAVMWLGSSLCGSTGASACSLSVGGSDRISSCTASSVVPIVPGTVSLGMVVVVTSGVLACLVGVSFCSADSLSCGIVSLGTVIVVTSGVPACSVGVSSCSAESLSCKVMASAFLISSVLWCSLCCRTTSGTLLLDFLRSFPIVVSFLRCDDRPMSSNPA